jgi:hypothetical protein
LDCPPPDEIGRGTLRSSSTEAEGKFTITHAIAGKMGEEGGFLLTARSAEGRTTIRLILPL